MGVLGSNGSSDALLPDLVQFRQDQPAEIRQLQLGDVDEYYFSPCSQRFFYLLLSKKHPDTAGIRVLKRFSVRVFNDLVGEEWDVLNQISGKNRSCVTSE